MIIGLKMLNFYVLYTIFDWIEDFFNSSKIYKRERI